jgi:hypothetical protein
MCAPCEYWEVITDNFSKAEWPLRWLLDRQLLEIRTGSMCG